MEPAFSTPKWVDIFKFLYSKKKQLIIIPFTVAIAVAFFTLTIPNRYTSQANLLPSQRPSLGFDLFSESGGLSSLASTVLGSGASEEFNRYIVLLTSYTTNKKVIEKFNLIEVYELQDSKAPLNYALEILAERTSFESKEEGNFIISVEDESPELAKSIASYYVELLNTQNIEIVTRDARGYREFIEKRYNQSITDSEMLKEEIISFQKMNGVFELPEQVSQYFSLIGSLTAKQLEAEIKLQILTESVPTTSDLYKNTSIEYEALTKSLEEIYSDSDSSNILLNFSDLSTVGTRYFELVLEAEIQAEIRKFLLPIYEQAKMEEAKSLPLVSVIDAPVLPLLKNYPKRSLIVISSGISAFILVFLYFILKFNFISNRDYFVYLRNK